MGSIPAGSTKAAPLPTQGRGLGISIGEDQPRRARRFVPTQSARGRSPKYSRREYQGRAPANAGARPWYFNRGGPAARSAAVRPDAVGTRAQPEVFPPGVPKAHPLLLQGVRLWYFNRGGLAAQGAAVRPDAVGTRAQPEVFPPGVGIKNELYQKILLSGKKE